MASRPAPPGPELVSPGLADATTTAGFRLLNFELFARKNKKVMILGGLGLALAFTVMGVDLYEHRQRKRALDAEEALNPKPTENGWN